MYSLVQAFYSTCHSKGVACKVLKILAIVIIAMCINILAYFMTLCMCVYAIHMCMLIQTHIYAYTQ